MNADYAFVKQQESLLVNANYSHLDDGFHVRYTYTKPLAQMAVEDRCTVLALLAADMRALAEQMETARLEIAQEELAA